MQRILLIGHDGQIGWELQRALAPLGALTAVCHPAIDFTDADSIVRTVRAHQPTLIVNAAAYTAVDKAESEPDLCRTVNAVAPGLLAEEARRLGAGIVHFSTDFVFDGASRIPYTETDAPNPLGVYARTKLEGEQTVAAAGAPHLIFRTAWVYGLRGRNFLLTLRKLAAAGRPLRVVNDQIGHPTWCRMVAETVAASMAILQAPRAPFSFREVSGCYHAVCAETVSWHGFAEAFLPAGTAVQPIPTAEYPTPARRPAFSGLDCGKLARTFGLTLPPWREALRLCLDAG